jgi:multidrug resistance efflux pump
VTAAPSWRITVTGLDSPLEEERAAHDVTRRQLAAAQARIERLRDELAAARAGTNDAREDVIRSQSLLLDTLQAAQWARDTEMAEHLNKHVCTPRPPKPAASPAQHILAPGRVW